MCVKAGVPIEKPRKRKGVFICLPKPPPSTTRTRINSAMENMEDSHSHQNTLCRSHTLGLVYPDK